MARDATKAGQRAVLMSHPRPGPASPRGPVLMVHPGTSTGPVRYHGAGAHATPPLCGRACPARLDRPLALRCRRRAEWRTHPPRGPLRHTGAWRISSARARRMSESMRQIPCVNALTGRWSQRIGAPLALEGAAYRRDPARLECTSGSCGAALRLSTRCREIHAHREGDEPDDVVITQFVELVDTGEAVQGVNPIRWERASATLASGTSKAVWELRSLTALGRSGPAGRDLLPLPRNTPDRWALRLRTETRGFARGSSSSAGSALGRARRRGISWRHPVNTSGIGADQPREGSLGQPAATQRLRRSEAVQTIKLPRIDPATCSRLPQISDRL